jgi:medium-chain acyl-[acyl-carrier-protein] hydrolase
MTETSPWFLRFKRFSTPPQARLFCLTYAGGGASVYRLWQQDVPNHVEVVAIQLPGREGRLREKPFSSIGPLIEALAPELGPRVDLPYAIFGHSMGSLVAFELTRALRRRGLTLPRHLFVSARRAPHVPLADVPLHTLPDSAFVEAINRRYGGIPDAILAEPELLELFIPIMRADMAVLESYAYSEEPPLPVPITVFCGEGDKEIAVAALDAWGRHTSAAFDVRTFSGGHFYLNAHRQALTRAITDILPGSSEG